MSKEITPKKEVKQDEVKRIPRYRAGCGAVSFCGNASMESLNQ